MVDHFIRVTSTVPAVAGQVVQLYLRERVDAAALLRGADITDKVVLFVHGAGTPGEVAFDLGASDYSWMAYLANAGFDTFAVDLTGYGRSTRTAIMDDPCNLPRDAQQPLIPRVIPAPCVGTYTRELTTIETDWDDVAAAVDYIRRLRRVERVNLVAWSRGGPRVAGFAAKHPEQVSRLVLLAPVYTAEMADSGKPAEVAPFGTQNQAQFLANWDRQVGCDAQFDAAVRDVVWREMLESDPVGATWGPGVRRAPATDSIWGFNSTTASKLTMPLLLVSGVHDKQVVPARVRQLYEDAAASNKVFIDFGCSSHMLAWERHHRLLFEASRQWLLGGEVNGTKKGTLRMGYEPDLPAIAPPK